MPDRVEVVWYEILDPIPELGDWDYLGLNIEYNTGMVIPRGFLWSWLKADEAARLRILAANSNSTRGVGAGTPDSGDVYVGDLPGEQPGTWLHRDGGLVRALTFGGEDYPAIFRNLGAFGRQADSQPTLTVESGGGRRSRRKRPRLVVLGAR